MYLKDYGRYAYGDAHVVGDVMVFDHSTQPEWQDHFILEAPTYEIRSNPEWLTRTGMFVVPFSQVTYIA